MTWILHIIDHAENLTNRNTLIGIGLAVLATLIWSGNFIVARGVIHEIPPVSLAFYRWLVATLALLPFAWKFLKKDLPLVRSHILFFLVAAAMGVSTFNTFVYIGAHYSEAINLAIIGTTSSPIITVILGRIFLKERISPVRIIGMLVCVVGILLLLTRADIEKLYSLSFSKGDWWVLAAAFTFSVYNILVRKKPRAMGNLSFLAIVFLLGTLVLIPFYLYEYSRQGGFVLTLSNMGVLLYLGLGASVICFLLWNRAIALLGSGRTSLFGNLIPVFSAVEAILILGEKVNWIQVMSFGLVITGLLIANLQKNK